MRCCQDQDRVFSVYSKTINNTLLQSPGLGQGFQPAILKQGMRCCQGQDRVFSWSRTTRNELLPIPGQGFQPAIVYHCRSLGDREAFYEQTIRQIMKYSTFQDPAIFWSSANFTFLVILRRISLSQKRYNKNAVRCSKMENNVNCARTMYHCTMQYVT